LYTSYPHTYTLSLSHTHTLSHTQAKLTHLCFNNSEPIICIGDDKGVVNILKLSANLRRMTAPTLEDLDAEQVRGVCMCSVV
jgi:hypothetical protein